MDTLTIVPAVQRPKRGRKKRLLNFEELKNNMFQHASTKPRICIELKITDDLVRETDPDKLARPEQSLSLTYNPKIEIVKALDASSHFAEFESIKKGPLGPSEHVVRQVENDAYLKKRDFTEPRPQKITKVVYDNLTDLMGRRLIEGTNILCWHCTLSFTSEPKFLPVRFINGGKNRRTNRTTPSRFESIGCFCSIPCAMAYGKERHLDKSIASLQAMNPLVKIESAPPKETLQQYGGVLTPKEYKEHLDDLLIPITGLQSTKRIYITRFPEVHVVEQTVVEETVYRKAKPKARFLDPKLVHDAKASMSKGNSYLHDILIEEEFQFQ